jgi:hypothetical protein
MMMHRRSFLKVMGGTALLSFTPISLGIRRVGAQETTDLAALGLPALTVTLTDDGYSVSPETTPAGWTLVTFVNQQSTGDNSANIMALPPGETAESIMGSMATAIAGGPVPAWAFDATQAGAPWTAAGTSAQGVIRLTAGDWVVFNGGAPYEPVPLTVTGSAATPAAAPALTADLEVTLQEFAFLGLDAPIAAGPQIWKVTNTGEQPHLMTLSTLPEGTTQGQYMDSLMAMMTGTPAAGGIPPDSMRNAGGCAPITTGQSLYLALDLAAGTYGAVCFFPDEATGAPHLAMGMIQVFTVG